MRSSSSSTLKQRRVHREGGVMHKVRSMESVSFHGLEFKGSWTTTTTLPSKEVQRNEKASRFSGYASAHQRYVHF